MLTSLERMTGMPVVWLDEQMGYVELAVPDARQKRLEGLIVRKGLRGAQWCPADQIRLIGESCVVLSQRPTPLVRKKPPDVKQAFLTSGQYAGQVTDGFIHPHTLVIRAVQISPGPIHRLLGCCAYACDYQTSGQDSLVITDLLSWKQLERRIGEEE